MRTKEQITAEIEQLQKELAALDTLTGWWVASLSDNGNLRLAIFLGENIEGKPRAYIRGPNGAFGLVTGHDYVVLWATGTYGKAPIDKPRPAWKD